MQAAKSDPLDESKLRLQLGPSKMSESRLDSFIWKPKIGDDVFYSFPAVNIAEAVESLSGGISIDKLTTAGSINNRVFRIERHGKFANFLSWVSPKKKQEASRVDLEEVQSIELGMNNPRFAKRRSKIQQGDLRCVTVTYGKDIKGKTLCLIFETVQAKEFFITAL